MYCIVYGISLCNVQGMLSEGSAILHTALAGRAYFRQVTIVVPAEWTETLCGQPIKSPTGNTPFRVSHLAFRLL